MCANEETVFNDVRKMLSQIYPEDQITKDTYLEFGDGPYLDMSSIEIVEFIAVLEKKYDIIIDLEDRYYTIGDVVHSIVIYLKEKAEIESEEKCESKI